MDDLYVREKPPKLGKSSCRKFPFSKFIIVLRHSFPVYISFIYSLGISSSLFKLFFFFFLVLCEFICLLLLFIIYFCSSLFFVDKQLFHCRHFYLIVISTFEGKNKILFTDWNDFFWRYILKILLKLKIHKNIITKRHPESTIKILSFCHT